jgi:hypothetical protein
MFKQLSEIRFVTDDGVVLAESESWGMRTERQTAHKKDKYKTLRPEPIADGLLEEVAEHYAREIPRGAEPLYWEDVAVGLAPPMIVRGPYSATVAVAFEQAWGGLFIKAHGYWFDYLKRHPSIGIPNAYGVPEPPEAVHWDGELACRKHTITGRSGLPGSRPCLPTGSAITVFLKNSTAKSGGSTWSAT